MRIETIHVYLPEEAVDCWFPVRAEHIRDDVYRILDDAPDDPVWQFGKGDFVRCRIQKLMEGSRTFEGLVAYEKTS